jgi:predicted RNase H-like HicB family nuclease
MVKEKAMNVVALVHHENGVYGVSFPDFPGCITVADDLDSVVAQAAEVLAFHVEGLAEDGPLPRPRSMSELERDSDFRQEAEGALLALVPYDPPSRAVRINITLDESLLTRIDRAAEAAGETRSFYLAQAAIDRLGTMVERAAAAMKPERGATRDGVATPSGAPGKAFSDSANAAYKAKPSQAARPRRRRLPKSRG